jgi:hypothetical protein
VDEVDSEKDPLPNWDLYYNSVYANCLYYQCSDKEARSAATNVLEKD